MLIKKASDIRYSEITPKSIYMNRRQLMAAAAAAAGTALLSAGPIGKWLNPETALAAPVKLGPLGKNPYSTSEKQTPYRDVTTYNNYYEFGTDKSDPARFATNFKTTPWTVSVEGEV